MDEPITSGTCSATPTSDPNAALQALQDKLQPLIDGGRLNNVVDLLSIVADMVDLLDAATVEKLATLFEQATTVSWELGNALRLARVQTQALEQPDSLYGLLTLLRAPDTRRGVGLMLRTLNIIGRQM